MKFYILTFGCKVNQCESENICGMMVLNGHVMCSGTEEAEVIIINSCTVTAESDRKLRQAVRKIRRLNPSCILILAGCMPQASPQAARQIEGINIIAGNKDKNLIPKLLNRYKSDGDIISDISPISEARNFEESFISHSQNRSRAFLKIEDGCDRYCSYCIIPYARGAVRSKPLDEIKKDVLNLAKNGYKEIVLVGINLLAYGRELDYNICKVIEAISEVPGIERIRLGSVEPDLLSDDIIAELSSYKILCPQFHLSLQSGSDTILKSMRRRYTSSEYLDIVQKIRKNFKFATFTTDVIVGFPGESEENFQETIELINKVKFLKTHVFPYSLRLGTLAAELPDQLSGSVKSERVKKMIASSKKSSKMVLSSFTGYEMDVLYETSSKGNIFEGYTSNYIPVKSESYADIRGKILKVCITDATEDFCRGSIIK